jgi:membrane protein implicated in regulation of membrane protease activity
VGRPPDEEATLGGSPGTFEGHASSRSAPHDPAPRRRARHDGDGLPGGIRVIVFVIVGAVGLLLLLSSIVLGDLLDAIGGGDGLVSGVALVALVVVQLTVRFVAKQESGGSYSPVGMVGVVTSPTSPTGGEVRLEHIRELERRLAMSAEPLAVGTRIRVVSEDGFRVHVEPDADGAPTT